MPCVCVQNVKTIQTFLPELCVYANGKEKVKKNYCSVRSYYTRALYIWGILCRLRTLRYTRKKALNIKTPPLLQRHSEYMYNTKNNHMHAMFQFVLSYYNYTVYTYNIQAWRSESHRAPLNKRKKKCGFFLYSAAVDGVRMCGCVYLHLFISVCCVRGRWRYRMARRQPQQQVNTIRQYNIYDW